MDTLELDTANWLLTTAAVRLCRSVTEELSLGNNSLKVAEQLARTTTFSPSQRSAVLQLAHLRKKAGSRYPQADVLYFTKDALEQLSNPQVAQWRAQALLARFRHTTEDSPERIIDLCAGVGGDAEYLGRLGSPLTCIEIDPVRAVFLRHNLSVFGIEATVIVADARTIATRRTDAVFADPARRHDGQRITSIAAYRPSVPVLLTHHAKAGVLAVAIAPGVDGDDPALADATEITYIDVAGQLTEAVVWGGVAGTARTVHATAVVLPESLTYARATVVPHVAVNTALDGWLITMRPAAVRARVHDLIAADIGATRVADHRAVFHSTHQPNASAWFKARRIVTVCSSQPKQIRQRLTQLADRPVEIVLHGADIDVTQLWQRIGSPKRGPTGWRVEIIRRDRDTVAVITDAQS